MKKHLMMLLFLSTALACATSNSPVARGTSSDAESIVRQLEQKRFAAMIARDTATLDPLLADDLTYTHSNALLENKRHFLETITNRGIEYFVMTPRQTTTRVYDGLVVVNGLVDVQVKVAGAPQTLTLRYTDAWVNRDGRWQMILWQSTRVP